MKKKILFISKKLNNPSTRYRALSYFSFLEAAGWQPLHANASSHPSGFLKILNFARQADIVVVMRKTFHWPLLRLLRLTAKKLIFDFDDAIFMNDDGSPSTLRNRRFIQMLKYCDHAWAGNSYLAEQAKNFCATTVIPTSVEPTLYKMNVNKPNDFFDLVWIGSSSTKKYLLQILPILERAAKKFPQLRLKIIADFSLPTQYLKILPIQWSSEAESQEINSAHVGIAPMIDNGWTRGKCALKVIQYMAGGLPVISSPVGANQELVIPGKTGFLAETETDWLFAIQQLQADNVLRITLGAAAQQKIINEYSFAVSFNKLLTTLQ